MLHAGIVLLVNSTAVTNTGPNTLEYQSNGFTSTHPALCGVIRLDWRELLPILYAGRLTETECPSGP